MLNKLKAKNTGLLSLFLLLAGTFFGSGLTFVTQIIIARNLGTEGYGLFSSTLAMVTSLCPLAVFGIPQLWLKVFGKEGWNAIRWLTPSIVFVAITTSFTMLILVIWGIYGNHNNNTTQVLIWILSFYVFGQVGLELVSSKYQLEESYFNLTFWQIIPHILRFILILSIVYVFDVAIDTIDVAVIYSSVAIIFAVMAIYQLYKMQHGGLLLKGHIKNKNNSILAVSMSEILQNSWPFALSTFFYLIYFQSDIILLKYMVGDQSAGIYNAAFTIMVAIFLVPNVIYQKFLMPKIHRWANHDTEQFYKVYKKGNILMLLFGIITMFSIWILSKWIIVFLFGEEYIKSVDILNILALSTPVIFLAHSLGATLGTKEYIKQKVKYMGITALVNILLNIVVIPDYGGIGASYTTVVSNILLAIMYYNGTKKIFLKKRNLGYV